MNTVAAEPLAAKRQALAAVRHRLADARERLRQAEVDYASTPDGACETYRRFELAGGPQRSRLLEVYLAGLSAADQEYRRRRDLGHANAADGPLEALAVWAWEDPLARLLVEHRVMGWVRNGPAAAVSSGRVAVGLIRLLPDGQTRKRLRASCPTDPDLMVFNSPLSTVIRQAWTDPRIRPRLNQFLGAAASQTIAEALDWTPQ